MRWSFRTGSFFLALGAAIIIGCGESQTPQSKAPPAQGQAQRHAAPAEGGGALAKAEAASEYVLTVEGMT